MATTLRPTEPTRHTVGPHVLRSALREPEKGPTLLRQHTLRYEKQPRSQILPVSTDDEFDLGRFQRTLTDFHYRRRGANRFASDDDEDDDPEDEELLESGDFQKLESGEWGTFKNVKFQKSKTARAQDLSTRAKKQPATARFTRSVSMRQVELPQRLKGILHNDTSASVPAQPPATNFGKNRPEPIHIPVTSTATSPEASPSQAPPGSSFSAPSSRSAPAVVSSRSMVTRGSSTTDLVRSRRFSESLSVNGTGNNLLRVAPGPSGKKGATIGSVATSPTDPSFVTSSAEDDAAHYFRPIASDGGIGNPRGSFGRQAPPSRGHSGNSGKVSAAPMSANATAANATPTSATSVPPHLLELLHKQPLRKNPPPPSFPGTSFSGPPFTKKSPGAVPKLSGWLNNRATGGKNGVGNSVVSPNSVLLSQQEMQGVSGANGGQPRGTNFSSSASTVSGAAGQLARAERLSAAVASGNWNAKVGGEGKDKRESKDKGVDSRPLGNQRRWINMFSAGKSSALKSVSKEVVLGKSGTMGPELMKKGENGRLSGFTANLNASSGGMREEGGLEGRLMRVKTLGRVEMSREEREEAFENEFSMREEDGSAKFKRSWTSNGVLAKKGVWEEGEVWEGEAEEWGGRRVSGEIARGTERLSLEDDDFVPLCEIYVPPGKAMVYGLVDERDEGGGNKGGKGNSKGERMVKVWGNGSVQNLESIGGTKGEELGRNQVERERVASTGSKGERGGEGLEVEGTSRLVTNSGVEEMVEREREGESVMEEIVMEEILMKELVVEEERKEEKREARLQVELEEDVKGGSAMGLSESNDVEVMDGHREEREEEREEEMVKERETGEEKEKVEYGKYSTEERLEEIAVALAMAASMENETGVTESSKTMESSLTRTKSSLETTIAGSCLETSVGDNEASLETSGVKKKTEVKVSMEAVVTVETISKEDRNGKELGGPLEGEDLNFTSLEEKETSLLSSATTTSATVVSVKEGFKAENDETIYSSMGLMGEKSFEMLKISHEASRDGDNIFLHELQSLKNNSKMSGSQDIYLEDFPVSEKMPILVANENEEEIAGDISQETIKCLKCNETVTVPLEDMKLLKNCSTDLRRFPCSSCAFDHTITCVFSEGKAYVALIISDMGHITPCEA